MPVLSVVALPANAETRGPSRLDGWCRGWQEYFPYGKNSDRRDERNRYRYIGVEHDDFVGLLSTGPRWFDPSTGRFLQCDPIAQQRTQLSPFLYSLGRPLALLDSSGYSEKPAKSLGDYTAEGLAHSTAQQAGQAAYREERRAMMAEKEVALQAAPEQPQEYAEDGGNFWALPSEKDETEAFLAHARAIQTYGRLGGAGAHSLALAAGADPATAADFAEMGAAGGDVLLGRGLLKTNPGAASSEVVEQLAGQMIAPSSTVVVGTSRVPMMVPVTTEPLPKTQKPNPTPTIYTFHRLESTRATEADAL